MFLKSIKVSFLPLIPTAFALIIFIPNISKPFSGIHDFNGVQYGTMAKNYLKYGFVKLKFGQASGHINNIETYKSFYTSYLPFLPMMIALSYSIFGIAEWSTRIVPVVFSVLGVLYMFLIVKRLWGRRAAFFASFFYIGNPMFIYFGMMPVVDTLTLSLMIVTFYYYLDWITSLKKRSFLFLCLSVFVGGLISWIIIYIFPLLLLHSFLIGKFNKRIFVIAMIILFTVSLQMLHTYILVGDILKSAMFETFKKRIGEQNLNFGGEAFSFSVYFRKELTILQAFITRTLIGLSMIGMVLTIFVKKNIQKTTLFSFLLLGIWHPLFFSRAVFIHEYHNIYFLPFLATAGAIVLVKLEESLLKVRANKSIASSLILVVFLMFITERITFTKSLLSSSMNIEGKKMAQVLNSVQNRDFEAVILSPRFTSFFGLFADYYTDYKYDTMEESDFQREKTGFKYAIFIDEDIKDQTFYNFMISKKRFFRIDDKTVVYLQ